MMGRMTTNYALRLESPLNDRIRYLPTGGIWSDHRDRLTPMKSKLLRALGFLALHILILPVIWLLADALMGGVN